MTIRDLIFVYLLYLNISQINGNCSPLNLGSPTTSKVSTFRYVDTLYLMIIITTSTPPPQTNNNNNNNYNNNNDNNNTNTNINNNNNSNNNNNNKDFS